MKEQFGFEVTKEHVLESKKATRKEVIEGMAMALSYDIAERLEEILESHTELPDSAQVYCVILTEEDINEGNPGV